MKAEREKIHAKVKADTVRLTGSKLELTADEETCTFLLVSEGSCTLQMGETSLLVNPGSALLLGAGDAVLSAAGAAVPELVGCRFPLSALHELRSAAQRDFVRLFLPGEATVLYGPVLWTRRLRTLLEMMCSAMPEQDYPGWLYLLLILHYVEQECLAESSAAARPRNETIEQAIALAGKYSTVMMFGLTRPNAEITVKPFELFKKEITLRSSYINPYTFSAAVKLIETGRVDVASMVYKTAPLSELPGILESTEKRGRGKYIITM